MLSNLQNKLLEYGDLLFLKHKDSKIKIGNHFQLVKGRTPTTNYPCQNGTIRWINSGTLTNLAFLTKKVEGKRLITLQELQKNQIPQTNLNRVLMAIFDFEVGDKLVWSQTKGIGLGLGILSFENNNPLENASLFFGLRHARKEMIQKLPLKRARQFTMIREAELTNFCLSWCSKPNIQSLLLTLLNSLTDNYTELNKIFLPLGDLLFQKHKDSQIKIKDHFKLVRGKTPPTKNPEYYQNGTIKWINSGVLTNLYFLTDKTPASKLVTEKAVQECQLAYAQPNSILISDIELDKNKIVWVSNNCSKILLGTHNWLLGGTDACDLPRKNATLFFALRQIDFRQYSSGSVINHLQGSALLNMKIDWVSDSEKQKIFFTLLNNIF